MTEIENCEGGRKRERVGRALPHGSVVDSAHITLPLCSMHPGRLRHTGM